MCSSAALLAGCASLDRDPHTIYFEPLDGGFKYAVKTSFAYPEDSAEGEKARREWLDTFVSESDLCANGYTIGARKVTRGTTAIGAELNQVFYTGHCN